MAIDDSFLFSFQNDTSEGLKRKAVSVSKNRTDLFDKSNEPAAYWAYIVSEIDAENEFIAFGNGVTLYAAETAGPHGRGDEGPDSPTSRSGARRFSSPAGR